MFRSRLPRTALLLALTVPGWAAPAEAAGAALARPRFDPSDRQLILPYTGEAPAFVRGLLEGPPRIFLDFEASTRLVGASEELPNHPYFLRWAMAPRGADRTRLVLHLRSPLALTVAIDPRRKALVLLAEPSAARPTPAPRPTAAPSLRPTPAPSPRPTQGPSPRPSARPSVVPSLRPSPVPTLRPSPTPWPSVEPSPEPTPSEAPSVEPSPLPTPSPTPSPEPQPSLMPFQGPALRVGLQAPLFTHEEQGAGVAYVAGSVRALGAAALVDGLGGPGWGARAEGMLLSSNGFEGGSLHARQELRGALDFMRAEALGPLTLQVGVGATGRYEVATHSSANALSPSFAPWRAFFGPEVLLGLQLAVPALPGWSVRVMGAGSPYMFAAMPQGALPAGLWGHRVDAALVAPLGPLSLSLGLRRWGLNASGYQELAQGPFLGLSGPWGAGF